jgi:hypothetical protein
LRIAQTTDALATKRLVFRVVETAEHAARGFTIAKAALGAQQVSVLSRTPGGVVAADPAHLASWNSEQQRVVPVLTTDDSACAEQTVASEIGTAE